MHKGPAEHHQPPQLRLLLGVAASARICYIIMIAIITIITIIINIIVLLLLALVLALVTD